MTPLQQMIAKVRNAHAMAAPGDVEHVKLFTGWQGHPCVETRYGAKVAFTTDSRCTVIVSPAMDDLHPWERDLVTNGEPFARPSNRVQS